MLAFRLFLENGLVNLAVIVGFLLFSISLIPLILWFGTPRAKPGAASPTPPSPQH